jgi:glycine cleavage system regulatory protein
MAHLAGTFAGILRVQAPADDVSKVVAAIEQLSGDDLKVTVTRGGGRSTPGAGRTLELEIVGLDRAGIVRDISGVLAKHGANIEELVTNSSSAPMSGELLFRAQMRLLVGKATDVAALRADLEQFANDLMVELRTVETVGASGRVGRRSFEAPGEPGI